MPLLVEAVANLPLTQVGIVAVCISEVIAYTFGVQDRASRDAPVSAFGLQVEPPLGDLAVFR